MLVFPNKRKSQEMLVSVLFSVKTLDKSCNENLLLQKEILPN
jgi:hypothetical protein